MYVCIHACMMNNQEVRNQRADRTTLSWLQEGDNALSHTEEDSEDSPDGEYVCMYFKMYLYVSFKFYTTKLCCDTCVFSLHAYIHTYCDGKA
jgi:hypothetical protein